MTIFTKKKSSSAAVELEDFAGIRSRRTPKKSSGKGKSGGGGAAGGVHTEVGAPGARGPAGPPVSQMLYKKEKKTVQKRNNYYFGKNRYSALKK